MQVILGRAPEHCRPADINLFDRLRPGNARPRHRLNEGIEIDHDQVNGFEAVLFHSGQVGFIIPAMQDPGVNLRMESLDAAIEHLGETGKIVDLNDLDAGLCQGAGRTASREDLYAELVQAPGEIDDSSLVPDAQKSSPDSYVLHLLYPLFLISNPVGVGLQVTLRRSLWEGGIDFPLRL